ncbi:MAG TPA: hypothetical protein VGR31_08345 [Planctomycetota bacterium]|jgi:hypothetical protein|nr:hypothetical protein [Planctomycetota bacterium]
MGHAVALTGAILLALASTTPGGFHAPQDPSTKPVPPLSKLKAIAGIAGFETFSTLLYAAAADRPHQFRATYVFPDRVRWQITERDKDASERSIQYRYGDTFFRLPPRSAVSELCEGTDRSRLLLQMELRRALMLYPDGFEWKGSGLDRRAELGELGSLFAHSTSETDKRPGEIGSAGPDGKPIDVYKAIQWRETRSRLWPASIEMWHAGELVWKETVDSVEVQGRFIDAFFLPPDRRDRSTAEPVETGARELDLPATCALRIELPKGTSWDDALAVRARARDEWTARLGEQKLELDPSATIEVAREGEPTAVVLRLLSVPEKPPAGFVVADARKARGIAVGGLREVTAARLADLRREVPADSQAANPYARFDASRGAGVDRVWIVLPYARAH